MKYKIKCNIDVLSRDIHFPDADDVEADCLAIISGIIMAASAEIHSAY